MARRRYSLIMVLAVCLFAATASCEEQADAQAAQSKKSVLVRIKEFFQKLPFVRQAPDKAVEPVKPAIPAGPALKTQETGTPEPQVSVKPSSRLAKLSKEELVQDILDTLEREDEILDYVPQIKKRIDPTGKVFYTYFDIKIEDLNREQLEKIYGPVHQTATRLSTERIQRQMESMRRLQELQRRTAQPPMPPRVPQAPPQPPKAPPSPPRQPQR